MNTRHKHCKQCQLDFTPPEGQAWMEYCSIKYIEDHQKITPTINPYPSGATPAPNPIPQQWFTTGFTYTCGFCGKQLVPNQPHQHQFTARTGSSPWSGQ